MENNIQDFESDIINFITLVSCTAIMAGTISSFAFIHNVKLHGTISRNKKWIDQLPSLISSAGVFGTFLGIAIGLSYFDPGNISGSIPKLLGGLKTAFYTSLLGLSGSMILSRYVNVVLDDNDYEAETEDRSTMRVVKAISQLQTALTAISKDTTAEFKDSVNESLAQINESLNQMKDDIEEMKGHVEELKETSAKDVESRLSQIGAICSTATASLSKIDNSIYEIEQAVVNRNKGLNNGKD